MAKLIALTLLQTCIIGGLPRSPVEGVQMVPEDEANNLVESNMAEFADVDTADGEDGGGDGDGLEGTIAELKAIAEKEKVDLAGITRRADIVEAIRAKRISDADGGADDDLDGDEASLREIAEKEGVTVEGDADKPTIIAAIQAHRSAQG